MRTVTFKNIQSLTLLRIYRIAETVMMDYEKGDGPVWTDGDHARFFQQSGLATPRQTALGDSKDQLVAWMPILTNKAVTAKVLKDGRIQYRNNRKRVII